MYTIIIMANDIFIEPILESMAKYVTEVFQAIWRNSCAHMKFGSPKEISKAPFVLERHVSCFALFFASQQISHLYSAKYTFQLWEEK